MRTIITTLILAVALINLSACSSMRGNVVPQSGPSMEQVYDGDGMSGQTMSSNTHSPHYAHADNLKNIRRQVKNATTPLSSVSNHLAANSFSQEFHPLPNPELKVYVYPHLAGQDQVPVPGYFTAFNAYDHDYYALANE